MMSRGFAAAVVAAGVMGAAAMAGLAVGCGESNEGPGAIPPATTVTSSGGAGGDGGAGTGASAGTATTTSSSTGSGGQGAGPSSCGAVLLEERFADADLAGRGWTGGLSGAGYSVVADAELGHNAYEMAFQTGSQSPGGAVTHEITPSEDLTIEYWLRVGPTWQWTVPHHMIMTHSNRDVTEGNGSPANAFGSTYFEWEWNDAGIFIGKFQDNRACNCAYGAQDLTEVTEERSVGGYQTWEVPEGQDASYWGDPCQDGLDAYTGQSVLTLHANAERHAMTQDEWWRLAIHLRANSIQNDVGVWDGAFEVELQGPNDSSAVRVMDFENVLWRAGGSNRDLAWAKLMIAPYLHDGATAAMWVRIADILVREGDCLEPD